MPCTRSFVPLLALTVAEILGQQPRLHGLGKVEILTCRIDHLLLNLAPPVNEIRSHLLPVGHRGREFLLRRTLKQIAHEVGPLTEFINAAFGIRPQPCGVTLPELSSATMRPVFESTGLPL